MESVDELCPFLGEADGYGHAAQGKASVNDEVFDFEPMSTISALLGEMHQIINTRDTLLRVLCIFSPAISGEGLRNIAESAVVAYRKEDPEG